MKKGDTIYNKLKEQIGSDEHTIMEIHTDLKTGESELVVTKSYTERFPVTAYEEVSKLYENLTRGGGRIIPSLQSLTK